MDKKILFINNDCETLSKFLDLLKDYKVEIAHWSQCEKKFKDINISKHYSLIILSPGRPISATKNYFQIKLILQETIPLMGICYGFQIISVAHGGNLKSIGFKRYGELEAKKIHGSDFISHNSFNIFADHKYALQSLPDTLLPLAYSIDGYEIIKAKDNPVYGFQFHPELGTNTQYAKNIFLNLLDSLI